LRPVRSWHVRNEKNRCRHRAHDSGSTSVGYATANLIETFEENFDMTQNVYLPADVVSLATAAEFIRGATKGIFFDDGPGQERRTIVTDELD
jgi:hypothetical protein